MLDSQLFLRTEALCGWIHHPPNYNLVGFDLFCRVECLNFDYSESYRLRSITSVVPEGVAACFKDLKVIIFVASLEKAYLFFRCFCSFLPAWFCYDRLALLIYFWFCKLRKVTLFKEDFHWLKRPLSID